MSRWPKMMTAVALLGLMACGPAEEPGEQAAAPSDREATPLAVEPAAEPGSKVFPIAAAPALDGPGRDAWQLPDEVVEALVIKPGDRVADVGCGTGYFTLRLARATGPTGHVLAVDIQQGMLDILGGRLDDAGRKVVELRKSTPERPLEPGDAIDLALCANTLHEVDDQGLFVQALADGLAPGGRLALINWLPVPTPLGPPHEYRLSPQRIESLASAAGLELDRRVDLLRMHSFLVFRKPE